MTKRILTGAAIVAVSVVIGVASVLAITPADIERGQNKVVPVPLNITPAARALQSTLDVADMHADSLLWQRDLLTRSDRGHVDLPRLIEGHYALQVFSSVTKSPQGQNYNANSADSDTITGLVRFQQQPEATWTSSCSVRCFMPTNCAASPKARTVSSV